MKNKQADALDYIIVVAFIAAGLLILGGVDYLVKWVAFLVISIPGFIVSRLYLETHGRVLPKEYTMSGQRTDGTPIILRKPLT